MSSGAALEPSSNKEVEKKVNKKKVDDAKNTVGCDNNTTSCLTENASSSHQRSTSPQPRPPKKSLVIGTENPFSKVKTSDRIRQLLHTHQGRDKLFKVLQYTLRVYLWAKGTAIQSLTFIQNADASTFTVAERNYMTVLNSRRLFRIGRFFGEFVRLRTTLIRCSELIYAPNTESPGASLFIQLQMLVDFTARILMLIKCVCDDIAYVSQKGFLHSEVARGVISLSTRLGPPVLLTDLFLNSLKLVQGILDAKKNGGNYVSNSISCGAGAQNNNSTTNVVLGGEEGGGVEGGFKTGGDADFATGYNNPSITPTRRASLSVNDDVTGIKTPEPNQSVPRQLSRVSSSRKMSAVASPFTDGHQKQFPKSFSLLSTYDSLDKIRRGSQVAAGMATATTIASPQGGAAALLHKQQQQGGPRTSSIICSPNQQHNTNSSPVSKCSSSTNSPRLSVAATRNNNLQTPPLASGESTITTTASSPAVENDDNQEEEEEEMELTTTDNYLELFWKDFELHWVMVTQIKLTLDCYVSITSLLGVENIRGKTAACGLLSGLLSVYRVWTYGR